MSATDFEGQVKADENFFTNPWAVFLLVLAGIGVLAGLGLTVLPDGPIRIAAFWLVMAIAASAIVGAVGWGYTETRQWERVSTRPKTDRRRILRYLAAGLLVSVLAVAAAMVPPTLGRILWIAYVPVWLVAGWWVRRRPHYSSHHRRVRP